MKAIAEQGGSDVSFVIDAPPRHIESYLTHELKAELKRRGLTDFSEWEWLVKASPFALVFGAIFVWTIAKDIPSDFLACLFGG
jgi:hypothetical protein